MQAQKSSHLILFGMVQVSDAKLTLLLLFHSVCYLH